MAIVFGNYLMGWDGMGFFYYVDDRAVFLHIYYRDPTSPTLGEVFE